MHFAPSEIWEMDVSEALFWNDQRMKINKQLSPS